ncbi:MAG: hypothetical protein U5L96_12975 [Owenweeksia sp.]|nr:hypothetical protein [Owenweeksia sp.]
MDEKNLFKYFAIQSKAQWIAKIEKDLNGKDFNSLLSKTAEGITIAPAYTEEDVQPKAQPFRENLKWDTTQEILVIEVKAANREALAHLERGATSLLFYLQGTENLAELLKDIRIEYIRLNLVVAEGAPKVAQQLARLMEREV